MLNLQTVDILTFNLLKKIQADKDFNEFVLVGGTALALQIGHRISIDLDFFMHSALGIDNFIPLLTKFGEIELVNRTDNILNLTINQIKVDFITYQYPFIKPRIEIDGIKLASLQDIGAMKLSAITGRGTKKDFVDLYFLLKEFSMNDLIGFYKKKYPKTNLLPLYRSLTYYNDADLDPDPEMLINISWEQMKNSIANSVKVHFENQ